MTTEIILYDIPSVLPVKAWSPSTWKVRYALNYKRLPYKTVWIEYPDIEPLAKKIGAEATGTLDLKPYYTLPIIEDPSTGTVVADSIKIVQYLDKAYPSAPQLIPPNTLGLHMAFEDAIDLPMPGELYRLLAARVYFRVLTPDSQGYFRKTREKRWGTPMEEIMSKQAEIDEAMKKVEKGMNTINGWYSNEHSVLLGDDLGYADLQLASFLMWCKQAWGDDSKEWKMLASWNGGRWENLLEYLQQYGEIL